MNENMNEDTPRTNLLETYRVALGQPRSAPYRDALSLCETLEHELLAAQERIRELEYQIQSLNLEINRDEWENRN
jgi:hypothetical protein